MKYIEFGTQNQESVILLHGGGLSWWNYREIALLLEKRFHVILPILDGHAGSDAPFVSIEENAAEVIRHIDAHFGGKVLALGGLSLGGQIVVEMLTQRPDICKFALVESASVKPMPLTHVLIRPTFGMSYGLIRQKWFAKMQAVYLGIPKELFDEYYRDTCGITKENMIAFLESSCAYSIKPALNHTQANVHIVYGSREQPSIQKSGKLLHKMIPNSTVETLPGLKHGELSLNDPKRYTWMFLQMVL